MQKVQNGIGGIRNGIGGTKEFVIVLVLAVARSAMARTQSLFCTTSCHFWVRGKGVPSRSGSLEGSGVVRDSAWCSSEHSHVNRSPLINFCS